jgi:hypothetical protein
MAYCHDCHPFSYYYQAMRRSFCEKKKMWVCMSRMTVPTYRMTLDVWCTYTQTLSYICFTAHSSSSAIQSSLDRQRFNSSFVSLVVGHDNCSIALRAFSHLISIPSHNSGSVHPKTALGYISRPGRHASSCTYPRAPKRPRAGSFIRVRDK